MLEDPAEPRDERLPVEPGELGEANQCPPPR
jgi:hypothetical protein